MELPETSIPQIYDSYASDLEPKNQKPLNEILLARYGDVHQRLATAPRHEFAKLWSLYTLAAEWLKYAIEDDYVDSTDIQPCIAENLRALVISNDWISFEFANFLEGCRKVAKRRRIQSHQVELCLPPINGDAGCRIKGSLSKQGQPLIPVSSKQYPFAPILENSLANPRLVEGVVSAFVDRLMKLKREQSTSCLCFIEKIVGPVGALSMFSSLVSRVGLPGCIYRETHWSQPAKLAGYRPGRKDRIAIVYDLIVTGGGILIVAKDLAERFGLTVNAAVVLFGYGPKRDELKLDEQTAIKVEALGWNDTYAPQFEEIREKGVSETADVRIVSQTNRRTPRSSALGRGVSGSPPLNGGKYMNTHSAYRWKPYGAYEDAELRVMKFPSIKEIDKAIGFIWDDPELKGVPNDSPDGMSLIVPIETVSLFRSRGLRFKVSELLDLDKISPSRLAEMRAKHGM